MIHKVSDFNPEVIVIHVNDALANSQTVDLLDSEGVECFAFLKDGAVPMVIIDTRKGDPPEVVRSLEARGVCATLKWESLETNMLEAIKLLQEHKDYSASKVIEEEMKKFDARKICQISW